jgi:uroporphyrinogen decarboxylase
MTGKERFLAAFAHQPVDRVPLFEQSVASSVASELLGRPALVGTTDLHHDQAEAMLRGSDEYEAFLDRVLRDNVAVADALGHSAVSIPWLLASKPTRKLSEHEYLYGDLDRGPWCIRRYDPESRSFGTASEGGGPQTMEDLEAELDRREKAMADAPPALDQFPLHRKLMDLAGGRLEIVGGTGIAIPLNETWLMATALRPDFVERHLDLSLEGACRSLEAQAAAGLRVMWGGYDLADNRGPIYGPRVFRELVLPRIRRMTDRARELGLVYLFRTDGKLWDIGQEFFIESGIHAYGEIDVDAGMDLVEVRRRYPGVALWGGIACGTLLQHGTPKAIRAEVRRVIEGVGTRGLVFGSSNSILHGTPVENVLAVVDEVNKVSREMIRP